jgi:hypothetical protein
MDLTSKKFRHAAGIRIKSVLILKDAANDFVGNQYIEAGRIDIEAS